MDTTMSKMSQEAFQDLVEQVKEVIRVVSDKDNTSVTKSDVRSVSEVMRHLRERKLPSSLQTTEDPVKRINECLEATCFRVVTILETDTSIALEFKTTEELSTLTLVLLDHYFRNEYSSEVSIYPELKSLVFNKN